ncbi:MAG: hypothetical protein K1W21_11310 [Oscillospiraceae bacterium]
MEIEITQEQIDNLVEVLEIAQTRLEQEAAALLRVTAGHELAMRRLKQADKAAALADFFLHL